LAKASSWQLFYPSVKTDGNESKKGYSLPSLLRDGQETERQAALAKTSRLATICITSGSCFGPKIVIFEYSVNNPFFNKQNPNNGKSHPYHAFFHC
jgi:hypothetical protein